MKLIKVGENILNMDNLAFAHKHETKGELRLTLTFIVGEVYDGISGSDVLLKDGEAKAVLGWMNRQCDELEVDRPSILDVKPKEKSGVSLEAKDEIYF